MGNATDISMKRYVLLRVQWLGIHNSAHVLMCGIRSLEEQHGSQAVLAPFLQIGF